MYKKYRKYFILLSLLFTVAANVPLSSQYRRKPAGAGFRVGPYAGLSLSKMFLKKNALEYVAGNVVGATGGVLAEYVFGDVVALQSGALFTQAGTSSEVTIDRQLHNATAHLQYIHIPLMLAPRFEQDQVTIHLNFGGFAGYSIGGTEKYTIAGETQYSSAAFSGNITYRKVDVGLCIGGGLEYERIMFIFNYKYGLANVARLPDIMNNKIITFSVGYMFGN